MSIIATVIIVLLLAAIWGELRQARRHNNALRKMLVLMLNDPDGEPYLAKLAATRETQQRDMTTMRKSIEYVRDFYWQKDGRYVDEVEGDYGLPARERDREYRHHR